MLCFVAVSLSWKMNGCCVGILHSVLHRYMILFMKDDVSVD